MQDVHVPVGVDVVTGDDALDWIGQHFDLVDQRKLKSHRRIHTRADSAARSVPRVSPTRPIASTVTSPQHAASTTSGRLRTSSANSALANNGVKPAPMSAANW